MAARNSGRKDYADEHAEQKASVVNVVLLKSLAVVVVDQTRECDGSDEFK